MICAHIAACDNTVEDLRQHYRRSKLARLMPSLHVHCYASGAFVRTTCVNASCATTATEESSVPNDDELAHQSPASLPSTSLSPLLACAQLQVHYIAESSHHRSAGSIKQLEHRLDETPRIRVGERYMFCSKTCEISIKPDFMLQNP